MDKANNEQLFSAMKSGVSACLTKNSDPEYLLDIIRVVAQGSVPVIDSLLIPEIASLILAEFEEVAKLNAQLDDLLAILSAKETEILKSIADGKTIEQITAEVDLNEENLRRNLRTILNKLVANEQSQTLFEAAQRSIPLVRETRRSKKAAEDYGQGLSER